MGTRRERIILDVVDNATGPTTRAAAAFALLNRQLGALSGSEIGASRQSQVFVRDIDRMGASARGADSSINQLTGRIRVLAEVGAVAGQALGPLGGVAIAGVAGLANQMGAAAIAGGVLIGSLQGVGDALGAMNKAQLDPTDKNLEAAEDALKRLSPAAREFAQAAFDLKPALVAIRDMGSEALMPGLTESLDSLERLGPRVGAIFQTIAGAMGDIAADSTASLASDRWADFFAFVEREVPDAITELAATVGDLTHGMTELWEAFTPLNDDFSSWLMDAAAGFDRWATGLSATDDFADFIDYVRTTGPQVQDTFVAIANALVQIVQASAPLGGPVLAGLEAVAKVVGSIADSDLGTPIMAGVAALSLLNRSLAVTASLSKVSMSSGLFAGLGTAASGAQKSAGSIRSLGGDLAVLGRNYATAGKASERMAAQNAKALGNLKETGAAAGKAGAGLAGLALLSTGAADGLGVTNTASLALLGTIAGPWGIAIGAGAGALLDLKAAGDNATAAIDGLAAAANSGDIDVLSAQIAAAKSELEGLKDIGFNAGDLAFSFKDAFGGDGVKEKAEEIKRYEDALEDMTAQQRLAEGASKRAALAFLSQTGANADLGKWSRRTAEEIKAQADAIIEAQAAARKTASSFVNLGESLNDSKVSLGDWIAQMSNSADALINFTKNSRTAAKRGLNEGLIASLQEAGEEGALRMRQLANATDAEIARANAAWRKGKKAMEEYENFKVAPKKPQVDINPAMTNIAALEARLRAIKDEDVFINVRQIGSTTLGPRNEAAEGGTVPKTGLPYADRHLYLLADGEEVISNRHGQADRHRSLLKAINGGLADGGTADKKKRRRRGFGVEEDTETERERERREYQEQRDAAREENRQQRARERQEQREARQQAQAEAEEARREHESRMFLAAIEGQERAAQGLIDAAEKQKQSAEEVRDGWAQAMERAGSAATAGFQSSLFGSGEQRRGLWAGGGGTGVSWLDALSGDISGLQQRQGLVAQLSAQGVTGSALEALLAQGSNTQVQELINSGRAGEFASMFAQREALLGSTSQMVGQAAYGTEFAAASAAVAALGSQILSLQAELAAISAQRPITNNVYEAVSAAATAAEIARRQALGAA